MSPGLREEGVVPDWREKFITKQKFGIINMRGEAWVH
ncbi:MAG: hypothetical protein ACI87W_002041 [Halieaceae bacterium]|jgi:hypothetical protein